MAEAFGLGGHNRIRKALDRMEHNLEAGDPIVDVIVFSRGAALAVAFANEVAEKYPTVRIRFLGIWDLVAEFGAPGKAVNLGYKLRCQPTSSIASMRWHWTRRARHST